MTKMLKDPHSNLYRIVEATVLGGRGFPHQSSGLFRPSEASATIQTKRGLKTLGSCPRATWYRLKGIQPSNLDRQLNQVLRMEMGKVVEDQLAEITKRAGIFIDRNVPFRAVFDGIPIAGEMDIICRTHPCAGQKIVIECKSIYNYKAKKEIFGSPYPGGPMGKPRDSYVMQLSLYLREFSVLPEDDPAHLPFGVIYIQERGDGSACTYDTWLTEETKVLQEGEVINVHHIHCRSDDLSVPERVMPYTVEDILSNFRSVKVALEQDTPPPRPFAREWDREQVEAAHDDGEISDSQYKKWIGSHGPRGKGKEHLGDWHCQQLYCKWSDHCWGCPDGD